jgi:hypothetical protein
MGALISCRTGDWDRAGFATRGAAQSPLSTPLALSRLYRGRSVWNDQVLEDRVADAAGGEMPRALRSVLLIISHLCAVLVGFALIVGVQSRETARRMLGTPQRRLGAALLALEVPTPPGIAEVRSRLTEVASALGEPTASVLSLRILAVTAKLSGDDADVTRAMEACRARDWPKCDRESILAMAAER